MVVQCRINGDLLGCDIMLVSIVSMIYEIISIIGMFVHCGTSWRSKDDGCCSRCTDEIWSRNSLSWYFSMNVTVSVLR